mmetsp:Transcript_22793/g.53903  ORF Transcript_22793/g.53903 Transcript_22793/m.53903 type:complete len:297 (-) Transcript_22793:128-1018(-)
MPSIGPEHPWPASLVRMFKAFRTADVIYQRILYNMSPKLLATVLRIFRSIDNTFVSSYNGPTPHKAELRQQQSDKWQSSMRCGMNTVSVDKHGGVLACVDVNPFWTDLAGLHREEYISRAFNGEMGFPTSELRQISKLIIGMKEFVQLKIAEQTNPGAKIERKPLYTRFSCNWGRENHDPTDGVLTRLRLTVSSHPEDPSWVRLHHSIVVVSAEEFEAVRAKEPELCEGYLVPVVGSKSAAELMDPRLLVEESFEHMNRSAEGRAQMDRLAEVLDDEFSFMFDFLAKAQLPVPLSV